MTIWSCLGKATVGRGFCRFSVFLFAARKRGRNVERGEALKREEDFQRSRIIVSKREVAH
jgi:hypothetical protein